MLLYQFAKNIEKRGKVSKGELFEARENKGPLSKPVLFIILFAVVGAPLIAFLHEILRNVGWMK